MPIRKVSEASGPVLDWMVTYALYGEQAHYIFKHNPGFHRYSTDPAQGFPIIEREKINIRNTITEGGYRTSESDDAVEARIELPNGATLYKATRVAWMYGPTPLIAAMRCYVVSMLGEEVEVPDELVQEVCTSCGCVLRWDEGEECKSCKGVER